MMNVPNTEAKRDPSLSKMIFLLTMGFSLIALVFSYSAQYIWNIEPCKLCKLQRIPYFFTLSFSGLAFLPHFSKISARMIQISFLACLGLSCYHLLVISGVVADPCAVPKGIASIEDFERMLHAPLPCSINELKLLGVPASGWNILISLAGLFFSKNGAKALIKQEKIAL